MLKTAKVTLGASVLSLAYLALATAPLAAKDFEFDPKTNREMARKLAIPVYFTVPDSARARLPRTMSTPDRLIDFRHPDALKAGAKVGLRLIVGKREGLARRLAKSGLVQTGDLLLTFRPDWGGVGAYPNVQMGISHTGLAYVKDGTVHNIDNPLDGEFIGGGRQTELNSEFYQSINLIHIVRPRDLTDWERANLVEWATRLNALAKRVYPSQIDFNQDYNNPKFRPGQPPLFVKQVGQIALGQNPPGKIDMYCSELAWSLLALRACDPDQNQNAFRGSGVPECVKPVMQPMRATGSYLAGSNRNGYTGLADGPLAVVAALRLPPDQRERMLKSIFTADAAGMAKLSVGHREIAEAMQEKFAKLEVYYRDAVGGLWSTIKARAIGAAINQAIPDNYSPTSYLINTLLPPDNPKRTMDYVATIVIE
ncbi:MAG: hypothetical protein J2P50_16395 [Hyphomicrobiaceae bacterium]|nr:hypothetical protein [Hyphomicrobiaceae bacterium]